MATVHHVGISNMSGRKIGRVKKGKELTKRILEAVLMKSAEAGFALVETLFDFMAHPHAMPQHMGSIKEEEAYWERRRMQRALRDLRLRELIAIQKKGDKLRVALTDEGRMCLLQKQMCAAPPCRSNECVIVIFDIPERERSVRSLFRRFLRECEFKQMQRSVWVSTSAVLPHLRVFIQKQRAGEWIRAFVARDALPRHLQKKRNALWHRSVSGD